MTGRYFFFVFQNNRRVVTVRRGYGTSWKGLRLVNSGQTLTPFYDPCLEEQEPGGRWCPVGTALPVLGTTCGHPTGARFLRKKKRGWK